MMQALHGHQNAKGKRPYVDVETRDFGTTHEIALRSPRTFAPGLYDAGGELLFPIENTAREDGGTASAHMGSSIHAVAFPPRKSGYAC